MKLRIKGNSIRLRLTQSEVEIFGREGRVADCVQFGPIRSLTYVLLRDAQARTPVAEYTGDEVRVLVPEETATQWVDSEQVGFRGEMQLAALPTDAGAGPGDRILRILVEKDFQCLVSRPHEDESDHYVNPLASGGAGDGARAGEAETSQAAGD
ncbi:MAG: hypothetical protein NXI24_04540 [bacterium]|nr:hypothetical protein [bacterium]